MTRIILTILGLTLMLNSSSYAATWTLISDATIQDAFKKPITLTDKAYVFNLDGMQCGVSEINLKKYEEHYFEMRHLYCYVSKDTRVSISLDINIKNTDCSDSRTLQIDTKDKSFTPLLMVSCLKIIH